MLKNVGGAPTETKNGQDHYTLPAIHDSTTGKVITDSANIAAYLDETYPDKPALFPVLDNGKFETKAAILAFQSLFMEKWGAIRLVGLSGTHKILTPRSAEYFKRTRETWFGKPIDDFAPPGPEREEMWRNLKEGLSVISELLDQNVSKSEGKLFLFGDTLSYADIIVSSFILWLKLVVGPESQEWKDFEQWNGGRWAKLLDKTKDIQGGN